ncbi:MAG TPA: cysteine desulfurase family protein [Patescibacteria group bacterium]|nr:cysteine desulfurase family protein [Patescibacteria group bacterium]
MSATAVYLDYNATAPLRQAAVDAMVRALRTTGNPSSVHGFGRAARRLVEDARDSVAEMVGAVPAGVVFTSGGSEANALGLTGFGHRHILASAVEHPSVLKAVDGVETVPVDRDGLIDLAALEALLRAAEGPVMVAVMLANNETGVLQPVAEVARIAHAYGALVHCDAVQAAGKVDIDMHRLGVDTLALSAHKLGGPQGVGALVLAAAEAEVIPLIKGGGQERRRRAGTENVPGIAGFAAAGRLALAEMQDAAQRLGALRDRLEAEASRVAPHTVVFGAGVERLPNTSCLALPGLSAQTAVMAFDLAGVAVSAGSACSSGKVAASHVLAAMGAGALAGAAIRVSLGWDSVEADVDRFIDVFTRVAGQRAASAA